MTTPDEHEPTLGERLQLIDEYVTSLVIGTASGFSVDHTEALGRLLEHDQIFARALLQLIDQHNAFVDALLDDLEVKISAKLNDVMQRLLDELH